MRVLVARSAGFCMGVRRALALALGESRGRRLPLASLGPLVHNPQAVRVLEAEGVRQVAGLDEVAGGHVALRAHGVDPAVRRQARQLGLTICDTTCPNVLAVQAAVKKHAGRGRDVVILGDEGHPEVAALLAIAGGRGHRVSRPQDLDALPPLARPCLVAQTTQTRPALDELAAALQRRYPEATVADTLCPAAEERQTETGRLAAQADVVIVVGGRTSANTARLTEIARAAGRPTYQVESAAELPLAALAGVRVLAVTAGASTPSGTLREVLDRLEELRWYRRWPPARRLHDGLRLAVRSSAFIGAGAASLTYALAVLQGIPPAAGPIAAAGLYVFAMHVANQFLDRIALGLNQPLKELFYRRHGPALMLAAAAAVAAAAGLAYRRGPGALALLGAASVLGALYSVPVLPAGLARRLGFRRLKDIPASKDTLVAVAWAAVTVLLPLMGRPEQAGAAVVPAFLFAFFMVHIRALLFDVRDIQGDRIVGRETVPTLIGIEATKGVLAGFTAVWALALGLAWLLGLTSGLGLGLLACVAYAGATIYLYHRRVLAQGELAEAALDANFLLAGLIAFLWRLV